MPAKTLNGMIEKAPVHYQLICSINAIMKQRNDACRKIAKGHLVIGLLRHLTHSPNEVSDKRSFTSFGISQFLFGFANNWTLTTMQLVSFYSHVLLSMVGE